MSKFGAAIIARRAGELSSLLAEMDQRPIDIDLVWSDPFDVRIYSRDSSRGTLQVQWWTVDNKQLQYDDFAPKWAVTIMAFWSAQRKLVEAVT